MSKGTAYSFLSDPARQNLRVLLRCDRSPFTSQVGRAAALLPVLFLFFLPCHARSGGIGQNTIVSNPAELAKCFEDIWHESAARQHPGTPRIDPWIRLVDSTIDGETLARLLGDDRSTDAVVHILGKSTITGGLLLHGYHNLPDEDRRYFFPTEDEKKAEQLSFDAFENKLYAATRNYVQDIGALGAIKAFGPDLSFENVDFYSSMSTDGETGVSALVVEDTLFRRPCVFRNCHFHGPVLVTKTLMRNTGDLDIGFAGLVFIDCKFDGAVYYEGVYIEPDRSTFQRSEFFDRLVFDKCLVLRTNLEFLGCTFHKSLEASTCQIEAAMQFGTCAFLPHSKSVFTDCEIDTVDDWNPTQQSYEGEFRYDHCNIGQYRCLHSTYQGAVLFENSTFGNIAEPLYGRRTDSSTVFLDTTFQGGCNFRRDQFHGETAFVNVSFGQNSGFEQPTFRLSQNQFVWSGIHSEAPLMGIRDFPHADQWMTPGNPRLKQVPYRDYAIQLQPISQALGELVHLYATHGQESDRRNAYYLMQRAELNELRLAGPSMELFWAEFRCYTWGMFTGYGTRWDWFFWYCSASVILLSLLNRRKIRRLIKALGERRESSANVTNITVQDSVLNDSSVTGRDNINSSNKGGIPPKVKDQPADGGPQNV